MLRGKKFSESRGEDAWVTTITTQKQHEDLCPLELIQQPVSMQIDGNRTEDIYIKVYITGD